MEIVPTFIEVLQSHCDGLSHEAYAKFWTRCYGRLNFGMKKYGKPLTTDDGRDSLQDAWEEAFDGAQYLLKAYLEGQAPSNLFHEQIRLLLNIEALKNNIRDREVISSDRGAAISGGCSGTTKEAGTDEDVSCPF
jgi:hypothetical protein